MPNHIHALFVLNPTVSRKSVVHSWKTWSARQINVLVGRQGALWQKDYFDRIIRDATHLSRCVRYIRRNPEKACLKSGQFLLYESEFAKSLV